MRAFSPFLDAWIHRAADLDPDPGSAGSCTALAAYQTFALRRTLARAKAGSRFYSRRLHGVRPGQIRTLSDLSRLPFTTPGDLAAGPGRLLCLSQDKVARIFTLETSGTTARPKRLCFTGEDLALTRDFFRAALDRFMAPGEAGMIFLPGTTPFSAGDLIAGAMEEIGCHPFVSGLISDPEAALERMRTVRPSLVIGMPVQMLALGEALAGAAAFVHTAILTADHVSRAVTDRVRDLLGCRVISHYGLTETGFGGAIQCPEQEGLHIRHPHLIVEIVDPETGRQQPPGMSGEVVVTTLVRRAMPLIRYRTGDVSRLLFTPCPCGSPFPRLARVRNRRTEGIDLGHGLVLTMADLDEALFTVPGVVDFTAAVEDGESAPVLNLILSGLSQMAVQEAENRLKQVPVLKKAMDKGLITPGDISERPWTTDNTYLGKRLIRDRRTRPPGQ